MYHQWADVTRRMHVKSPVEDSISKKTFTADTKMKLAIWRDLLINSQTFIPVRALVEALESCSCEHELDIRLANRYDLQDTSVDR